ncbi:MAG: glycosyltransferase family 4 protein [Verrucomicrobiota bacterium]
MKIFMLGGIAESLINFRGRLIEALIEKQHSVITCASGENGTMASRIEGLGADFFPVPLQRAGYNPIRDHFYFWGLHRLMKRERPDVVLTYTAKPIIYGSLAARLARVPNIYSIITGLGYGFSEEPTFRRKATGFVLTQLYGKALRVNRKVFFQNPDDEALFRSMNILPETIPGRVVNGSGVDLDTFQPAPPRTKPVRFLLIARLLKDKGIGEFVEAAATVHERFPQTEFEVVGSFDPNPAGFSRPTIERWKAEGPVRFAGAVEDVRPHLDRASVYVLPSYREGLPRTVLEAMAMQRPVITTDAPGCRETVIPEETGLLVPPGDSGALCEAMLRFIEQPTLIETMGTAGRRRAETCFDVRSINRRLMEEMDLL